MLWKKKLYCYIFVAHKIFYFVYPHIFAQVMPLIWLFCLFMYSNLRKNGQVIRFFSKEQNHHRALACFLLFPFSWKEACFLGFIFCLFACTNGSDLKNLPYNLGFSFWNGAACLLRKIVQDRLVYPGSSVGCTSHGVRVQAEHFTLCPGTWPLELGRLCCYCSCLILVPFCLQAICSLCAFLSLSMK